MNGRQLLIAGMGLVVLTGGVFVWAQDKADKSAKPAAAEQEREVKESEVPAAALAALKKLAGDAPLTEFAEEVEHGITYYEGSWKGPDGNVDALVTAAGDVVEIEASIPAELAPATIRALAEKEAGKDAKVSYEKKTLVLYEIHFKKEGKGREMIFAPDGRRYHEDGAYQARERKHEKDEDEDEHEAGDDE